MTDHANELRRYSRKIGHPAGDVPSVMLTAADEIERLAAMLEAAEKERDDVAQQLVQSEIGKREISEAHDAMQIEVGKLKDLEVSRCVKINGYIVDNARLAEEVERLRAKIEQMEQQVPVAWQTRTRPAWNDGTWGAWRKCSEEYAEDIKKTPSLHDWLYEARALYALPGAKGE